MARKTQNVKKKKIDYLGSLKGITKWITNQNRKDDQLVEMIEKYQIKNTVVKRILSYNYGFPHIIKYFNTYMNNLYEFDRYDTRLLIKSLVYVMDVNNRSNSRNFMFLKSATLKDDIKYTIKNLIKDYLSSVHNIECNRRDLNSYYRLFKLGVIKDEDLLEIDRLLNGDKPLIKSLDFINYNDVIKVQDLDENQLETIETGDKEFSEEITNFMNGVKTAKTNSDVCKSCGLYAKPTVVLDTNRKDMGETDVVFVGLNPGKNDAEKGLPFIDGDNRLIRNIINQLPRNKTWMMFNIILCSTSNKNEITAVDSVNNIIRNCMNLTGDIFKNFPTKLYIPVGNDAKSVFNITDKITTASGKIYQIKDNVNVIPLISPGSIARNSKNKAIYDKSVQNIIDFISPFDNKTTKKKSTISVDKETLVSDDKDLLLLDVKRIENNQLLMIYTDHAGNKKYLIKDYSFPVLIKNDNWENCNMITDKFHDSCQLTDWQKTNISKKCHQILKRTVEI